MQVTKYITTDVEVTADINIEDVIFELHTQLAVSTALPAAQHALNAVIGVLRAIPDVLIAQLTDGACEHVCSFLRNQANRYDRAQQRLPLEGKEAPCTTPPARLIILFDQIAWIEDHTQTLGYPGKDTIVHFKNGEQCTVECRCAKNFVTKFLAWLDGPAGKEVGFHGHTD